MPSNYPNALDALSNPSGADRQNVVPHSAQHTNANDAIEALQATLGVLPQGSELTVAARMGDVTDINDLPLSLTPVASPDKLLVIQADGLVRAPASDVLNRARHTGSMPVSGISIDVLNPANHTAMPKAQRRAGTNQAIPNDAWHSIGFTANDFTVGLGTFGTGSTTVAAGSNGVALPTGTINVASTAAFPSSGTILITGPPGASTTTMVAYLDKTATSFTGCFDGSGTLATGQSVVQPNTALTLATPGTYLISYTVSFAAHATGKRGVRLILANLFPSGELVVPSTNTQQVLTASTTVSSDGTATVGLTAYQNSGGVLNTIADLFNAPRINVTWLGV